MNKEKAVMKFIEENFEPSAITIEKSNLLPFAQIVKDATGGQMIVYYDLLKDVVSFKFPTE